jgi:peptidoglycan/LPS O-acetylase OafA/YrhL
LAATLCFGNIRHFGVGGRLAFLVGFPRMIYPFAIGVLFARASIKMPSLQDWQLALILILIFAMPFDQKLYSGLCCIVLLPAMVLLGSAAYTSSPAMWEWLGRISYPLYLLHVPVLEAVRHFLIDRPLPVQIAVAIALSVGSSVVALLLYDEPLRLRLGKIGRQRLGYSLPTDG